MMKKLLTLIGLATLLVFMSVNISKVFASPPQTKGDTVYVWASPKLAEIATTWLSEYTSLNPELTVDFKLASEENLTHLMNNKSYLGFYSKNFSVQNQNMDVWKIVVGREVVVPVINSKNPLLDNIKKHGISQEKFSEVLIKNSKQTWGDLLGDEQYKSVKCNCFAEQNIDYSLSKFLNNSNDKMNFSYLPDKGEFVDEIKANKYSIGFCRLTDIINPENGKLIEGISLVPIDLNNNKKVDYFEDIYNNSAELERGVWIGKYPKALYQNIYATSVAQPITENNINFLEWVLSEGQQYLLAEGYSELVFNEKRALLADLSEAKAPVVEVQAKSNQNAMLILIAALFVVAAVVLFFVLYFNRSAKEKETSKEKLKIAFLGQNSVNVPGGLFFDKSHTWAFMEKDGAVRVGMDDFMQHITGIITKVKMKKPGEKIKKGEVFLTLIQNGKQLEIKSPLSGTIIENNTGLQDESAKLNNSPYGDGWVYMIQSDNWIKEIKSFFMGEDYKIWLQSEFSRLKDFLSLNINTKSSKDLQFVMQDGGELKDHILEEFGPVLWEEFQNNFINSVDKQ